MTSNYLSLYPHKIISFTVPNKWILNTYLDSISEHWEYPQWKIANIIAKKGLAKYYNLEESDNYKYDLISASKNFKFKLNFLPVNDYSPKFGELITYKIPKYIANETIYIFGTYYLPKINVIGYLKGEEIGSLNLKEIKPKNLHCMNTHSYLSKLDKNNAYV